MGAEMILESLYLNKELSFNILDWQKTQELKMGKVKTKRTEMKSSEGTIKTPAYLAVSLRMSWRSVDQMAVPRDGIL